MGKIIIELIDSGERIVTEGMTFIEGKAFGFIDVTLVKKIENYRRFSDSFYGGCKPVHIQDFQRQCIFEDCRLLSTDGQHFVGEYKQKHYYNN